MLCLAAGDTRLRYPDLTGLEYDKVRSARLDSPARLRLVILDCYDAPANSRLSIRLPSKPSGSRCR